MVDTGLSNMGVLAQVVATILLAAATVSIHSLALWIIRKRVTHLITIRDYGDHILAETRLISLIVVSLSFVHFLEIAVWAVGYLALGALDDLGNALYYSITTYTTVGPDGLSIGPSFRGIAGFESLIGPMMVAWSTAFLVEFVTRMRREQA